MRDYHGLLALRDDAPVGLAHYIFHRHGWHVADVCYLQDLFVAPEARGDGVGRALIEAVYAEADAAGAAGRLLADPGVQRHRPAALRPDRTRHAVREVRALSRSDAHPPHRRARARRARRLRRDAAGGSRDQLGPLRRGHAAARAWRARTGRWPRTSSTSPSSSRAARSSTGCCATSGRCGSTWARPGSRPIAPTSSSCWRGCATRPGSTSPRPATRRRRRSSSRRCRPRRSPGSSRPRPASSCRARPTGAASCGAAPEERLRWPDQATLERAAIFLPLDTTPQDVRDCLNEEITQALGPADDLYRLPDTIWNDDNFHGMATPFDMLMLRTLYQPELRSGMSRGEVAARAAAACSPGPIPRGAACRAQARARSCRPGTTRSRPRCRARRRARDAARRGRSRPTRIAAAMRPVDHRLGVSLLTAGPAQAAPRPGGRGRGLRAGLPAVRRSLRRRGHPHRPGRRASRRARASAPGSTSWRSSSPTATCRRRAPGRTPSSSPGCCRSRPRRWPRQGDAEAAQATRLDCLRWARYGFGDADGALAREQAQIAAADRPREPVRTDAPAARLRPRCALRLAARGRARR